MLKEEMRSCLQKVRRKLDTRYVRERKKGLSKKGCQRSKPLSMLGRSREMAIGFSGLSERSLLHL